MKFLILPFLLSIQIIYAQTALEHFTKGTSLNYDGYYEDAILEFNKAILLDSTYADAYNDRGFSYDKLAQYDNAMNDFNQALQYYNGSFCLSCCYLNIGLVYGKTNQLNKAVEYFQKAIEKKNEYGEAYYNLAYTYHLQEEYKLACETWKTADQYGFENAEYMIESHCK